MAHTARREYDGIASKGMARWHLCVQYFKQALRMLLKEVKGSAGRHTFRPPPRGSRKVVSEENRAGTCRHLGG